MSRYFTIESPTESLYKEKGSKFIGLAFPLKDEVAAKHKLEEVKGQYHDARHHCYAWRLGLEAQKLKASDDGEPSHSAGEPILGQIKSHDLTNVMVVVVRYFGGTKLGVGGLITAYRKAANDALVASVKRQIFEMKGVHFRFDYPQMSTVERLIADFGIDAKERDFRESCMISGLIKKDKIDTFLQATTNLYNVNISIDK